MTDQLSMFDNLPTTAAITTGVKTYDAILHHLAIPLTFADIVKTLQNIATTRPAASVALTKAALKAGIKTAITDIRELAAIDAAFKIIKVPKPDRAIKQTKLLTDPEISAMISRATPRRVCIIKFLRMTGCRVAEMAGLKLSDCTRSGEFVTCRVMGKGKKERTIYITADLFREIRSVYSGKNYLFETSTGHAIIKTYYNLAIKKSGEMANLAKKVHPHMFRHTFITGKIKAGKSLKAVSLYAGHASTATTADMYVHDELTPADAV